MQLSRIISLPFLFSSILLLASQAQGAPGKRCCWVGKNCAWPGFCSWCKCIKHDFVRLEPVRTHLELIDEVDDCEFPPCSNGNGGDQSNVPGGNIVGDVSDNDGGSPSTYSINLSARSSGIDGADENGDEDDAPWFDHVKANFQGTDLKRCFKSSGVPPEDGTECERFRKTCFFGTQDCGATIGWMPTTRCFCDDAEGSQTWSCSDQACPASLESPFY